MLHHHYQSRHWLVELAQVAPGLTLQTVVAKVVAVIRHQQDHRIVFETRQLNQRKELAQPAIDHRHLTGVERPDMLCLALAHDILDKAVARVDQIVALVAGIVHIDIVLRRIPRLVRVPRVDPQKELFALVVLLQPVNSLGNDART